MGVVSFGMYASDYYHVNDEAKVLIENVRPLNNDIFIDNNSDVDIIFFLEEKL